MDVKEFVPIRAYGSSVRSCRLQAIVLGPAGFDMASFLRLCQFDLVSAAREQPFCDDSHYILKKSSIAHFLRTPGAMLGAVTYLPLSTGGAVRCRTMPFICFGAWANRRASCSWRLLS